MCTLQTNVPRTSWHPWVALTPKEEFNKQRKNEMKLPGNKLDVYYYTEWTCLQTQKLEGFLYSFWNDMCSNDKHRLSA